MAPDLNSLPASSAGPPPPAAPAKQPNILYVMADQLAAPQLKMYNPDSQILTPHLDALAAQSVQFDAAYCPSPLCAPSRMSMITGRLPMAIGAYDNAAQIGSDVPTYAHYLRRAGYHTVLAGKMHFVGDQLHGYETRLTSDIYPGDFGWVVNWDAPETRLEWYHNASSVEQAGVCVRSNQLDYDNEVMFRSEQFLYDHVRSDPATRRPFCLTVSLTHPHDPYTIHRPYWDRYEGVDIALPRVRIPQAEQDPHSRRLLKACDLWDRDFADDQIRRARRAYYGAVSYVDDCLGRLLAVLRDCGLADDTIVVFSGDHGDMLGERGLWYKMSYFESSVRVPLLVHHPQPGRCPPHRVAQNVSTLDLLPTLCGLVGVPLHPDLPLDGQSLLPYLQGAHPASGPVPGPGGHDDTVFAEYTGEGTVSPLMMIRRGPWKFTICPTDGVQLFHLPSDPDELVDLAKRVQKTTTTAATTTTTAAAAASLSDADRAARDAPDVLAAFEAEAARRWDFDRITRDVRTSQRQRLFVWGALKTGHFTSWDHDPRDDGREKYIRSHMHLDDLERRARYPPVDAAGNVRSVR